MQLVLGRPQVYILRLAVLPVAFGRGQEQDAEEKRCTAQDLKRNLTRFGVIVYYDKMIIQLNFRTATQYQLKDTAI